MSRRAGQVALPRWLPIAAESGAQEREADLDAALAAVLAKRPGLAGATFEAVISRRVRLPGPGLPGAAKRRDPTLGELRCRRDPVVSVRHAATKRRSASRPDYSVRVSRAAWEAARTADAAGGSATREWLVAWLLAPAVAAGADWTTDQHFGDARRVAMRHESQALVFGLGVVVPGKRVVGATAARSAVGRAPRRPELGRHTSVCLACRGTGRAGCPCAARVDRLFAGRVCWRGAPLPDGAVCAKCGGTSDVRRCTSGNSCLACLLADHAARCGCGRWAKFGVPDGTRGVPDGTQAR